MKLKVAAAIVALSAAALCAHPVATKAAGNAAPPPAAAQQGPNWLHLTPDQQKRMNTRQQKMNKDMTALVNDKKMTNEQKSAKAQQLQKQYEADMMAMLTPQQKALVAKQKTAMLKRKKFADARMKQIMEVQAKLMKSLTPDQQKQINTIRQADMKTFQSIEGDKKMSQNDKMAKIMSLSKDEQTKITALLTPAQRADFQKLQDLLPTPPPGAPR